MILYKSASTNNYSCVDEQMLDIYSSTPILSDGVLYMRFFRSSCDGPWGPRSTGGSSGAVAARYIHSKGLKFGMYGDEGSLMCGGTVPGDLGSEELDASA